MPLILFIADSLAVQSLPSWLNCVFFANSINLGIFLCSVYAVTHKNRCGIIVCDLPYGILVATYSFPCTSVKAIDIVEKACELLRGW